MTTVEVRQAGFLRFPPEPKLKYYYSVNGWGDKYLLEASCSVSGFEFRKIEGEVRISFLKKKEYSSFLKELYFATVKVEEVVDVYEEEFLEIFSATSSDTIILNGEVNISIFKNLKLNIHKHCGYEISYGDIEVVFEPIIQWLMEFYKTYLV